MLNDYMRSLYSTKNELSLINIDNSEYINIQAK